MSGQRHDLTGKQIKLTPDMTKALVHAATSKEPYVLGFSPVGDAIAEAMLPSGKALVIEAYLDEENGGTPLLVNQAWNTEGSGAWLEPDGGWHFQPDESGYFPWKMEEYEYVLGLTGDQAQDLLATIDTFREGVKSPLLRGKLTALLDNIAAQLGAHKED